MANLPDFSEHGVPAERTFYTIGFISQLLSQPPHFVATLAKEAGVQPCYVHNGIPTFNGTAVERMVDQNLLEGIDKSVVRGPLTVKPHPAWFFDNKTAHEIARKMVDFEASPSWLKIPGLALTALRG